MSPSGRIFQINRSNGGVPKHPVRAADVTAEGVAGDRHNDTQHHGGPERALCLYSLERIVALQAEGHPIFPGSIGENITVTGLDWPQVVAGAHLRLGDELLIEVTRYTTPCATITDSFVAGDISRVSHTRHPGWSRVYARVLRPGRIRIGDRVVLL